MEHVQDEAGHWTLTHELFGGLDVPLGPVWFYIGDHPVQLTKFMLLELLAAGLLIAIFIPLCRRAVAEGLPKGAWWNFFESFLSFVREGIAKPALGEHDADKFVPFLWTMFLFILLLNLLGMIPFMGSPTASIWVTGGMALISFVMMHGAAMVKMGVGKYFTSMWPHIEIVPNPWRRPGDHGHGHHDHGHGHDDHGHDHAHDEPLPQPSTKDVILWGVGSAFGFGLSLMIYVIEMFGTVIKSFVLAVRLFANMFGGHMVLATILFFIYAVGNAGASYLLWGGVTFASVMGVVALSLLELFVAFLQAYVFTFLTALFMGMSLNPEH
jgi:F-type H+-transporting ATPase subunit a